MKDRLVAIRKDLGLTMEQVGQRLGVGRSTISRLESGVNGFTEQMIKSICREFNVDYLWFTTGQGEMFSDADEAIMARIDNIMMGDSFAREVFKRAALLDEEDWIEIERIAKKLLEPKNE